MTPRGPLARPALKRAARFAALIGILAGATEAAAEQVRLPLTVDYVVLRAAVGRHLREQPGGAIMLWRSSDGCSTFHLRDATVGPAGDRLKITGKGSASAGLYVFGLCFANVSWDGLVEILARPELGRDWQLRLRDPDMELYDADRQQRRVATRIFSVAKDWADAELTAFTFDLGPPVQDLRGLLASFAASADASAFTEALKTLRPLGVAVLPDALRIDVALDVPPVAAVPRAPEPALSPAQLKRWEATLDGWDGFLAFVVKDLGGASADPADRDELLDVLLSARRDLVALLGRGPEPGADPVRALFVSTWERLRVVLRRIAAQRGNEPRALRYVVFLAAGDALAALEAAAPALGIEFSADGLRRLARALDPGYTGDPLEYSETPDPKLQQLFRFRDPDAAPRRPRRKPAGGFLWPWPRAAYADEAAEWRALGTRLDRWVPVPAEVPTYRRTVDRMLALAAERSLDPDQLDERYDDLFVHLVKTVAWQESCWRQFVRKGDGVTYISSSTGDVGMMQINVRVWRGFFSPDRLRWSATYNAGAGAEILQHLLVRYGTREGRDRLENAARATYAAYNGGPVRYRRYRLLAQVPAHIQAIDRAFYTKYRLIASGEVGDRVLCLPPGTTSS